MERAILALDSGQPGVATLYMRKALAILAANKPVLVPSRTLVALSNLFEVMGSAFMNFVDAITNAFSGGNSPDDFILVSES